MAEARSNVTSAFDPAEPAPPTQAKNAQSEPQGCFAPLFPPRVLSRHRRVVPMGEQIGAITDRLINQTSRPKHAPQPSLDFWRNFNADLKAAKTPEAKDAVFQQYAAAHANY